MAVLDKNKYDYYHLITGQDFYSTNPHDFDKLLGDKGYSYFEIHQCPRKNWWGGGYDIIKLRTLSSYFDIRNNKVGKIVNLMFIRFQRLFHLTRPLPDYPLYCGSVYGSLHKNAAQYILNSPIAKDLLKRLRNSTCGEEIFFQTVLMNSNFTDKIVHNNMRYIDWNVASPPKFLTVEDYEKIISSHTLFCRKIDSKTANKLLPLLTASFYK